MPLPRVRFTVRGLSLYIVFAGVLLALARLPFLAGCAVLVVGVAASNFLIPTRMWRFVVYGGIAGILVGIVVLSGHLEFVTPGPRSYTDGRLEAVFLARPYVVQIGALAGGSIGLVIFSSRTKNAAWEPRFPVRPDPPEPE
jgi:hypothetical protein